METTVSSLEPGSKFLISRFSRQRYIDAHEAIDETVNALLALHVAAVVAFGAVAIVSPSVNKQLISVDIAAAGTIRVRKPSGGCTDFTLLMKTPANVTVNAFPSGSIMPQIAPAQVIHSIRFIWDVTNSLWRSVRTT